MRFIQIGGMAYHHPYGYLTFVKQTVFREDFNYVVAHPTDGRIDRKIVLFSIFDEKTKKIS